MKYLLSLFLLSACLFVQAQVKPIYNPEADAKADIAKAVQQAKVEGKHVFLQIGGNWCVWCRRFHQFTEEDSVLNQYMADNYVVLKVNYSKENKNLPVLESLGYPQRFGFPVFVILNADGERIHTQNSAYLEEGGGYSQEKVLGFLKGWSPEALSPSNYLD